MQQERILDVHKPERGKRKTRSRHEREPERMREGMQETGMGEMRISPRVPSMRRNDARIAQGAPLLNGNTAHAIAAIGNVLGARDGRAGENRCPRGGSVRHTRKSLRGRRHVSTLSFRVTVRDVVKYEVLRTTDTEDSREHEHARARHDRAGA